MKLHRICLLALLFGALLSHSPCDAQLTPSRSKGNVSTSQSSLLRKEIIERHFESIQPRPRPQFDGAIPGSRLLEQKNIRAARLQSRVRATLTAQPEATGGNTTMPGIQFRPALPAGSVPTSVVTGDFDQDGHIDFIV